MTHSIAVVLFHTFFVLHGFAMKQYGGVFTSQAKGYPYWSYISSCTNGGIVMPVSLFLAFNAKYLDLQRDTASISTTTTVGGDEGDVGQSQNIYSWFSDEMLSPAVEVGSDVQFYISLGNAALCAAMLKDFVVYDSQMELWLALHHVITVSGCIVCIAFPAGNLLAAANSTVAELGSTCYNLYAIGIFPKIVYIIGMVASNVMIVVVTLMLCQLELPLWMQLLYVVMCVLILLVRTIGVVGDISSGLFLSQEEDGGGKEKKI